MNFDQRRINPGGNRLVDVKLTVIYDIYPVLENVQPGRGFACVAEVGENKVLFDTGSDGLILLENMKNLGIEPKDFQLILISHNRCGHIGGLDDFLLKNPEVSVYVPQSFPDLVIENIERAGAKVSRVFHAIELRPNVFTLGEFAGIFREQAMALRTSKGIVVVTGCAHSGALKILHKAKAFFPEEPLYLFLGGFHFAGLSDLEISNIVKNFQKFKVQNVAPCHCADETGRLLFKRAYGENYIEMGVGGEIKISINN